VVRLSLEDRQRAMDEHIRVGREFETIHNHTTYSFGSTTRSS
jgi:chlorite dismutase